MLRIGGNSIRSVVPVTLYLVSDVNNKFQFIDVSNSVVENPKLQTLVMNDIQASAGFENSKRYFVDGITYLVDFTRYN